MPEETPAIKHIVVLMMENRSFDHMLGFWKAQNPLIEGLTGKESIPDDPTLFITCRHANLGLTLPDIPSGLLVLMGISHGTYLGTKAAGN